MERFGEFPFEENGQKGEGEEKVRLALKTCGKALIGVCRIHSIVILGWI